MVCVDRKGGLIVVLRRCIIRVGCSEGVDRVWYPLVHHRVVESVEEGDATRRGAAEKGQ